jgi:hypothetical protein
MHTLPIGLCAFLLGLAVSVVPGHTQSTGCLLQEVGGTGRQVVRCGNDIRISVEAGAEYSLHDRNSDGLVDQVRLRSRALLLVIEGEAARKGFEVVAPQAIAAVRGTRWAIDAASGRTSVFVAEGQVSVIRRNGAASVTLSSGEGVDVDGSGAPLEVRRWPRNRVNGLLDRTGR